MEPSDLKMFISVKSYDEETAENYRNCYVARKVYNFKTITYIDSKFW